MSHQQYPSLSLDPKSAGESGSATLPVNTKVYELKGFMFSVLTMCLRQWDVQAIEQQLTLELANLPDLFSEPIVVDLQDVSETEVVPDFSALFAMMFRLNLTPVGICNGNDEQKAVARSVGVPVLAGGAATKRRPVHASKRELDAQTPLSEPSRIPVKSQSVPEPSVTHIVDAPVRTGQRVFSNGDVTVLAAVNPGAEVLAAGSIHVYGPLRGRALAGIAGDRNARIFTKCMEAELVSIAGCFRVLEDDLGRDVQGKPAQIYLDGERVVIKPL